MSDYYSLPADKEKKIKLLRDVVLDATATPERRATPYQPRSDDIIVAGYAKSGTTWLQHVLHQIRTNGDESFSNIYEDTFFLPDYNYKFDMDLSLDQVGGYGRILKSHAKYENMPKMEGKTRFVVIVRDPYDAELSMVKFFWRFFGEDCDMASADYERFAAKMSQSDREQDYCGWLSSWWPHRKDPNVLWLHYENLQRDLGLHIDQIAQFYIGRTLDEDSKKRILYHCSHEFMLAHKEKFSAEPHLKMMVEAAKVNGVDTTTSASIVRHDGAKSGQGQQLYETAKKRIAQRWKDTMEKNFGIKSYADMIKNVF